MPSCHWKVSRSAMSMCRQAARAEQSFQLVGNALFKSLVRNLLSEPTKAVDGASRDNERLLILKPMPSERPSYWIQPSQLESFKHANLVPRHA